MHFPCCARQALKIRLILGLIQSLVLYALIQLSTQYQEQFVFLFPATIFIPLVIIQGIYQLHQPVMRIWIGCLTVFLLGSCYYQQWKQSQFDPILIVLFMIGLFIGQVLVTSAAIEQRFQASYQRQYDLSWKLAIQIILTALFVSLVWGTIGLGYQLFKLVDIHILSYLCRQSWFLIPVFVFSTVLGIHFTDVKPNIIGQVRSLILRLFTSLLPLFTLMVLLFIIGLLMFGASQIFTQKYLAGILMWLAFWLILLINAAYQDGKTYKSAVKFIQYSSQLGATLLPLLVGIAGLGLYLRVSAYGFSNQRIIGTFVLIILSQYAIGYCIAVFRAGPWLKFIETCNFYTALSIIFIVVALLSPIADPSRLMVQNQQHRFLTQKISPDKIDTRYIYQYGGSYGKAMLNRLSLKLPNHADNSKSSGHNFLVHPRNDSLPSSFLETKWVNLHNQIPACLAYNFSCHAWRLEIKQTETIILLDADEFNQPSLRFWAFQATRDNQWRPIGQWIVLNNCKKSITQSKLDLPLELLPPSKKMPDLKVAGFQLQFLPFACHSEGLDIGK